ncbi:hypothetical protein L1S35_00155 [Flavobacterium sp. AS60]|uniref:hypothetical protein n=1 Tax=Flavobacterium anseongense TaxID=2910677 RepID=UPI001F23CB1A|nr:hypothetical protein [Flavobacterium sp. AS60]MCF6128069.1 hypothetical protein [Flavobacterium sp. AS60]
MKIYDSFGTFDSTKLEFNLAGQTTNIDTDLYEITDYYDISNASRYAIVAILQTKDGNDKDLSTFPADCACMASEVPFTNLNQSYLTPGDKDIFSIQNSDTIDVILHHGIGFDPINNTYDDDYIKNYKAETYVYYSKGSPPGARGTGILR